MMLTAPVRSVITGGPGVGKSTLLAAAAHAGIPTFPEVARDILRAPGGMAMRAEKPAAFASAMLDAEIAAFEAAGSGPALYDRGFPDIVGFLKLEGLTVPAELDHICRTRRYEGPIFRGPPWQEIFVQDEERIQDWDQALASDRAVCAAWIEYGYRLVDLPLVSVPDRLAFVMRAWKDSQG